MTLTDSGSRAQTSASQPNLGNRLSMLSTGTAANMTVAETAPPPLQPALPPFIKIVVRETDDIDLYAANSITVPKEDEEARRVEEDNKLYDYLTVGKGRTRRTSEAEAQTAMTLFKTRAVNTDRVRRSNIASYVSNFDMFDTYAELERSTQTLESADGAGGDGTATKLAVTTYSGGGVPEDAEAMLG